MSGRLNHDRPRNHSIILGLILPALVPAFAFAHLVVVIGVILLVVGAILAVLGSTGRAVGGRRHYY